MDRWRHRRLPRVVTNESLGYPLEMAFDDIERVVDHLVAHIDRKRA